MELDSDEVSTEINDSGEDFSVALKPLMSCGTKKLADESCPF